MKVYAIRYKSIELDQNTQLGIQYGAAPCPESRYRTRELAAADCVRLNQRRVQIGSHCCAFAVDQLPEGDFGIICACHPMQMSAA